MTARILIAGVLGGIVLFLWGAAWHMLVPDTSMQYLSDSKPVQEALQATAPGAGFYLFPARPMPTGLSEEQQKAEEKKMQEEWEKGPSGVIVYLPSGGEAMSTKQLVIQFATDLACGLIAAMLLAAAAASCGYLRRVLFTALLGLLAFLAIALPQWNWYGFPADFTLSALVEQTVGFLLMGFFMALIIRKPAAAPGAPIG